MPKSKRAKVVHLTQVEKRTREQKERLFDNIRACVPEFRHCLVVAVDNMRNNNLKDVRHELSDCRLFFGKTKLMTRALGTTPEESQSPGLHHLAPHLHGTVGLIFTNRHPPSETILPYLASLRPLDYARAGTPASATFTLPPGLVYSTGGQIPAEHDTPLTHTMEPELRRLGVPTRLLRGKIALGGDEEGEGSDGYVVCRRGEVLDSRQTRLLKMFGVKMSEFRVVVRAWWDRETGEVVVLDEGGGEGGDKEDEEGDMSE